MAEPREPAVPSMVDLVRGAVRRVSRILLRGFVVIVPFVVLLFLFDMALGFVRGVLEPLIKVLEWAGVIRMASFGVVGRVLIDLGFYDDVLGFFTELVAVLVLLSLIVFLGVFASFRLGKRTVEIVDAGIAAIPGIGSVYRSLRRMGDIALESGLENFRSVKLVEFPQDDHYSLAFETNRAPDSVEESTNEEDMVTLFVPLAPNPVMGGFLVHVARDRILDVDMTVEEAARALVTSGIAAGESERETPSVNPFQRMKRLENVDDLLEEDTLKRIRFDDRDDDEESRS